MFILRFVKLPYLFCDEKIDSHFFAKIWSHVIIYVLGITNKNFKHFWISTDQKKEWKLPDCKIKHVHLSKHAQVDFIESAIYISFYFKKHAPYSLINKPYIYSNGTILTCTVYCWQFAFQFSPFHCHFAVYTLLVLFSHFLFSATLLLLFSSFSFSLCKTLKQ